MAIRVIIADDHELVREGLRTLLASVDEVDVVGEARNGAEAISMSKSLQPDVVLMDIQMPVMDGLEATLRMRDEGVPTKVLVLTTFLDKAKVKQAIQSGAIGYLLKDVRKDDLVEAIVQVAQGQPSLHPEAQKALISQVAATETRSPFEDLTAREKDVVKLIANGRSNKEIGNDLNLTEGTVKGYVSAIFTKIGVQDRTQAALLAVKHDLV